MSASANQARQFWNRLRTTTGLLAARPSSRRRRRPDSRTRALNSQYIVVFKNPRDNIQIDILGRQIYPSKKHYLLNIYKESTIKQYSYLLIDLCQQTSELTRFRSYILPDEKPMYAYVDKHLFAQTQPVIFAQYQV